MRFMAILVALTLPAVAGCLSDDGSADSDALSWPGNVEPDRLLTAAIEVPSGAELVQVDDGFHLDFGDLSLPASITFTVPEGATMVRFVADPGDGATVSVSMSHAETGRRRCNQQSVVDLDQSLTGPRSCSSIAAIDHPGASWTAAASGTGSAALRVELLDAPIDGIAARLDLTQISRLDHDLGEFWWDRVTTFDGHELHVEVSLPAGEGPWPTIISSSPYNQPLGATRPERAMWSYFAHDWTQRGYAVVNADVRGSGESGGCMEVWGMNEQRDQAFLVDWAAEQDWSDGNVGFYGQSYVGTTPVEAAVQAPEALKAIIAVAPVINAYEDWHYGGVPNGESLGSPAAYQATSGVPADPTAGDPLQFIENTANGLCHPTLVVEPNDPRAIFNEFFHERDFRDGAPLIQAATLYTQGFEDANVKSAMIDGWFNEIDAPKLGVFGHWLHQHPARMDEEVLFVGWFDQYLKGRDLGFERVPDVVVSVDENTHRTGASWPPHETADVTFQLDTSGLVAEGAAGSANVILEPTGLIGTPVAFRSEPLESAIPLAGNVRLDLEGGLIGAANAYVYAALHEEMADGSERTLTWGQFNLAHRYGHDRYAPLLPLEAFEATLPMRATEHIVAAGSTLRLEVRAVQALDNLAPPLGSPGVLTLDFGDDMTALHIPSLPLSAYEQMPRTALP